MYHTFFKSQFFLKNNNSLFLSRCCNWKVGITFLQLPYCLLQVPKLIFIWVVIKIKSIKMDRFLTHPYATFVKLHITLGSIFFHCMDKKLLSHSSEYLLCSTKERNSHRFETTWGWVNKSFNFLVNNPFTMMT